VDKLMAKKKSAKESITEDILENDFEDKFNYHEHQKVFLDRFERLYPGKRLLEVRLDGFSHSIAFDGGSSSDEVKIVRYSNFAPEIRGITTLSSMFEGYPNGVYQNNAKSILYVEPKKR
jgi:hypothetical protein